MIYLWTGILDINEHLYSSAKIDILMRDLLKVLFEKAPNLLTPTIKSVDDIKEIYQSFRSWRRTLDTRAS